MNYYRRYLGDYLRDTARLSVLEHGAYGLLLDYYYAEERPIALNLDEVCRMVRAISQVERGAIERVLKLYFKKGADAYHHKRADHEIYVAHQARKNGQKGGRPITGIETAQQTGTDTEIATGTGHPPTTNHQPPEPAPKTKPPKVKRKGAAQAQLFAFQLPTWIPKEAWDGWVEARVRIGKPMNTSQKFNIAINRLDEMRGQGHDIKRALENATLGDWTSLWPARDGVAAGGAGKQTALEARNAEVARRFVERGEKPDGK